MDNKNSVIVKTYTGSHAFATATFRADAVKMAAQGYFPTSQTWVQGTWTLSVTYELRATTAVADEKTCPQCAERVKVAAKVCRYCGHQFVETPAQPPRESGDAAFTSCRKCKTEVSALAKVCPKCGVDHPAHQPPSKSALSAVQVVAGLFVGLCTIAYLANQRQPAAPQGSKPAQSQTDTAASQKSPAFVPYSQRLKNAQDVEARWRHWLAHPSDPPASDAEIGAATMQAGSIPTTQPEYAEAANVIARLGEDKNASRLKKGKDVEARWRASLSHATDLPDVDKEAATATAELEKIPKSAPEYVEAEKLIARFTEDDKLHGKLVDAHDKQIEAVEGPKARREFAKNAEHEFLMRSMDATFVVEGSAATTLRFKYVLAGRPLAEQLKTDGKFIARCRDAGFKRLILDNGFGNTWTFEL